MTQQKVNIPEVIGHLAEVEFMSEGYFGSNRVVKEGRIIFSVYQAKLMLKPKGARNKGYSLSEKDILSVKVIKKDKKNHEHYLSLYQDRERLVEEENERQENMRAAQKKREEEQRLRRKQEEEHKKNQMMLKLRQLGNYDVLIDEMLAFYKVESNGKYFNEHTVQDILAPVAQQLIHLAVTDVNDFPKYYFCKERMPIFSRYLEQKLGVKFSSTQKGNVEILNVYLLKQHQKKRMLTDLEFEWFASQTKPVDWEEEHQKIIFVP